MTNLICNSFDEQYKRIQTFRNHYLNMIRILLKNKSNLNLKQIMTYNEIELNTNQLMNSITEFIKDIKNIKNTKENKKLNLNDNFNNEDLKMIHTLSYFLPFMLLYYNTLNLNTSDNNNNHQYNDSNNDSNNDCSNITNNTTLEIPLD